MVKMSLNFITNQKKRNLQEIFTRLKIFVLTLFFSLAKPNCGPKDGQFVKHCQTPLNYRFQLNLWCLPSERHFEALTLKLSIYAIMAQKMADLQNSVTRL